MEWILIQYWLYCIKKVERYQLMADCINDQDDSLKLISSIGVAISQRNKWLNKVRWCEDKYQDIK